MSQTLVALERLQELDAELDSFAAHSGDAYRKVTELEALVAKATTAADAERGKVADAERARLQITRELEEEKDRLKKWDGRIVLAKHQKDFTALQREAEGLRKSIAAKDEAMDKQKLNVDEAKHALRQREAEITARQAELDVAKAEADKTTAAAAARVAVLQGQRNEAKVGVEAKVLGHYEAIRKRRPGTKILVPVVAGNCTGCNKKIAPAINLRLMNSLSVELCPCSLKLVYARNTPPPAA